WIKENLPLARVSGGISNISFSFRGNNAVREAMHSVFLFHAIRAGLDMGIVNAGMLGVYEEIPKDLLELVEDVLLNRRPDATERLVKFAESIKKKDKTEVVDEAWRKGTVEERLSHALVKGITDYIDTDIEEARIKYDKPLLVIEGQLIGGATTSKAHTSVKIAPNYNDAVVHVLDASRAVGVVGQLINPTLKTPYVQQIRDEQEKLRQQHAGPQAKLDSITDARANALKVDWKKEEIAKPEFTGARK